jgi:hypothetical protein
MPLQTRIANTLFGVVLATAPFVVEALLPSSLSAQTGYYVSNQAGRDSWSGRLPSPNSIYTDGPFQTLAKAQSAMQGSGTKTTTVRAGTYSITSVWRFSPSDNGESWVAYPGESVTLDGGSNGGVDLNNFGAGGVSHVTFDGLTFLNMGTAAVNLGGDDSMTFRRNTFLNCNQNCIRAGHLTNSTFDSNIFRGQFPGSPSGPGSNPWYVVDLFYGASGIQFTHNLVESVEGGAISFGGAGPSFPLANITVDRNIFRDIGIGNVGDTGVVYVDDPAHVSSGIQITNNFIDGNAAGNIGDSGAKAFYLDDNASNALVSGNICRRCGQWAWQIHGGDHNVIVNNIFDLSTGGLNPLGLYQTSYFTDYGMAGNVFQRNIIYFSGSTPSSLYQVDYLNGHNDDPLAADSGNLYYSATGSTVPNGARLIDSNPVYANPLFTSPSSGDYSMPSSSPAYTRIGFQQLATDQGPAGSQTSGGQPSGGEPSGGQASGGGGPIANGTYTITNNTSGFALDDPGWAAPGAQVIQWPVNVPGTANQRWVVSYDANKQAYTMTNQFSGGLLTDTGAALFENSPAGDATQLWTISSGSGGYVIKNVATGKLIDNPNFSLSVTGIITWPANGGTNQGWNFQ